MVGSGTSYLDTRLPLVWHASVGVADLAAEAAGVVAADLVLTALAAMDRVVALLVTQRAERLPELVRPEGVGAKSGGAMEDGHPSTTASLPIEAM